MFADPRLVRSHVLQVKLTQEESNVLDLVAALRRKPRGTVFRELLAEGMAAFERGDTDLDMN